MQELEKILEEIELEKKRISLSRDCSNEYAVTEISLLEKIEKIIRKHMNDSWISVEERLPEEPKENPEFEGKKIELYLVAVKGTKYQFRAMWNGKFFTDGWSKCNVIAWRPLPEPYKPKQPETCKYTGGSCCWPIDQCSDCPNNPERSENDQ